MIKYKSLQDLHMFSLPNPVIKNFHATFCVFPAKSKESCKMQNPVEYLKEIFVRF